MSLFLDGTSSIPLKSLIQFFPFLITPKISECVFCFNLKVYNSVIISDKPGKPEGPLEAKDITAEGCKLEWNKPLDDGGLPVTGYVIEKMDTASGRWVPCGKTDGPNATSFDVSGLDEGKKYEFRVKAVNEEGESEGLESEKPVVAKNPYGK